MIDRAHRTATLTKPGMKLDLGGIAKGYAAEAALEVLAGRREDFPQGPQTTTLHVLDNAREALRAAGRAVPKS